jgi:hypothetical protein
VPFNAKMKKPAAKRSSLELQQDSGSSDAALDQEALEIAGAFAVKVRRLDKEAFDASASLPVRKRKDEQFQQKANRHCFTRGDRESGYAEAIDR